MIKVEVVYGYADQQTMLEVVLPDDATAQDAIIQSGILLVNLEIDLNTQRIGIFGKFINLASPIKNNDRIEIYRSLTIDPKEARKSRVVKTNRVIQ